MALFDKKKLHKIQAKEKTTVKHIIMLVDDEEGNLKSMAHMLLDSYDLMLAHNGQEAMDRLHGMSNPEDVSVIISDQRMPGLTGIQLFERLIPIIPNTIRIILTGFPDINVIIESIDKAKIHNFILKPFNAKDLLLTLERAIKAFELKQEMDRYYRELEQKVEKQAREIEEKNNQLQEAYKKLEEARLSDPLTGLRNRRYLQKFIPPDISKVQRDYEIWVQDRTKPLPSKSDLVFLVLGVDHFKSVNNTHGQKVGDRVLKQMADILHRESRQSDILVRWADEEFLMVYRFTARDQARILAERLRKSVEEHLFDLGDGQTSHLTCSIGLAVFPFLPAHPDALEWEQMMNIADQALCAAKKSGRNAWVEILGTDKTNRDNLSRRIQEDINLLLANGELTALTSIPKETALVWG